MPNRLAHERSPYLLQHAHNPVDWYPWGDEAFERARTLGRPVFLSVGYSACHWCHVMERESFEDQSTAALLNERYVCVKVDREERPDVDHVYQLAYQAFTRRAGGWPLSAFLTPERRPFFLATYLPPVQRHGTSSFRDVLLALHDAWTTQRHAVLGQGEALASVLREVLSAPPSPAHEPQRNALVTASRKVLERADSAWGGFGGAPKFPSTLALEVLACEWAAHGTEAARAHFARSLEAMERGGMHDHLGGGFARYSTDGRWLVPHFEKMLYDNALLLRAYTEGWRVLGGDARCAEVADSTVGYLLREMTCPETGVFFSAQDADSEGEEGRFFVWTREQLEALLPSEIAAAACAWFDVKPEGNFEHGRSVLWTPRPADEVARELGCDVGALRAREETARAALFAERETRVHPARDDKALASWNGLLVGALAEAGATLGRPAWLEAARRALGAWEARLGEGFALPHACKGGEAYGYGFLDDYGALAGAALTVFEACFEARYLTLARGLLDAAIARFWDEERGVFYSTPAEGEVVLVRPFETHDHAWPGGTGLIADALLRLATLTGEERYRTRAARLLGPLVPAARDTPMGMASVTRAVDRLARGDVVVVLAGPDDALRASLLAATRAEFVPHRVLLSARNEDEARALGADPAHWEGRFGGATRAYVCRGSACMAPTSEPDALRAQLREARAD